MKVLHTADLHLQEYNDARWNSLKEIVRLGKAEAIDVLTICGDLFESTHHAHKLRPKIREIFSGLPFTVLIIPGNHDAEAYPDGVFLGEKVTVIRDLLTPVELGDVFFWGFPFEEMPPEEILEYLHLAGEMARKRSFEKRRDSGTHQPGSREEKQKVHVLLFHGELLDIVDGWSQYGDEGKQRYLPVKLSYFRTLPWHYVLAGHFHINFSVHRIEEERFFVYSGSPVSITRRELGTRQVNLFTIGGPPASFPLHTPYYEKLELHLNPFLKQNPVEILSERLAALPEHAYLLVEIDGYFDGKQLEMSEEEFHRAISKLIGKRMEVVRMEFRDIREIMEDDLFKRFMTRLNRISLDDTEKQSIVQYALQAMIEARP